MEDHDLRLLLRDGAGADAYGDCVSTYNIKAPVDDFSGCSINASVDLPNLRPCALGLGGISAATATALGPDGLQAMIFIEILLILEPWRHSTPRRAPGVDFH